MPKERFHLYLADKVLQRCAGSLPLNEFYSRIIHPAKSAPDRMPDPEFFIGAISPDIFFYDLPSFSLSVLGDRLHDLMDREGISVIYEWLSQTLSPNETAGAGSALWGLGFACHFLIDAVWHPVIDELSGRRPKGTCSAGRKLSEIQCHRLLESELEALWLAGSAASEKYDELLEDFRKDRGRLFEIASYYRRFLEFAGGAGLDPAYSRPAAPDRTSSGFASNSGVSEKRIVKCFLNQFFLLRLFANRTLGRQRDRMLSFPPTRFLGALITPPRPALPASLSHSLPEDRNPFSKRFMERALASLEADLCGLTKKLPQFSGA